MQKKVILGAVAVLLIIAPILFIYLTFANSVGCNQLVIDTYELHSGIDIPEVEYVNCYYDKRSSTRISIYDLDKHPNLSKFNFSSSEEIVESLQGHDLLDKSERPNGDSFYLASGEKWGTKWTYLFDTKSNRLWAELKYEN